MMDPYSHVQYVADFVDRMESGERVSAADMHAYAHEHVQFIDEQLSSWWQNYCVGEMSPATLREALDVMQAVTRAALRYALDHDWHATLLDGHRRGYTLVFCFVARLEACEELKS